MPSIHLKGSIPPYPRSSKNYVIFIRMGDELYKCEYMQFINVDTGEFYYELKATRRFKEAWLEQRIAKHRVRFEDTVYEDWVELERALKNMQDIKEAMVKQERNKML